MSSQSQKEKDVSLEAEEEDEQMYGHGPMSKEELEQKFPNRPHNHSLTLPFHELYQSLFNPLDANNKKKATGPNISRAKKSAKSLNPHEVRRNIIEKFISRWRLEVGNDFYPALRLIIPEKDRDRAMYGLKERNIGKILVKILGIDKNSEDAQNLANWKLPGQKSTSAGDFAGRCFEVISKRPRRTKVGDMRIGKVNVLLDQLSASQKEDEQLPIFQEFYQNMNADELMWLIRIILRQMKVGATEKTFLNLWHPDAEALFNISSNLRRCCWELADQSKKLGVDKNGETDNSLSVSLMECFQPQLAQFQMHDFKKMVDKLTDDKDDGQGDEFWIEEKLDGERMQLHMVEDPTIEGGKRFGFWSRKAKDYTYLYGNGFFSDNSALSIFLKDAFDEGVRNIILDGEMITWDSENDVMIGFGTLKTAATFVQQNPHAEGWRPLFRVFDILLINDAPLTNYYLRERRKALERFVKNVHRRIEIHPYEVANDASEIEPALRKVVAEASEGLVLKNPRSSYRLNSRNDDWIKVKPEYMTEFGESLDCVVIGGYYGSGHRGGGLSSFLCGLRLDKDVIERTNSNPEKCLSFFKVGGGFRQEDYANIRHHTEGKWIDWDQKNPPTEYIELAGGSKQCERPDVWIKPSDSLVISSKAASVAVTDQFATGFTLRFPRFRQLRMDRSWDSALSVSGFKELKENAEIESKEKKFEVEGRRRGTKKFKPEILIAGEDERNEIEYAGPSSKLFEGLNFHIMSERTMAPAKTKQELEQLVKAHGGKLFQSSDARDVMVSVSDKKVVKAAAVIKKGSKDIVNSSWILDCIKQAEVDKGKGRLLLPWEPRHMYHTLDETKRKVEQAVDEYGDSYARDVTMEDLREIVEDMPKPEESQSANVREKLREELGQLPGYIFQGLKIYMEVAAESLLDMTSGQLRTKLASNLLRFGGGEIVTDLKDESVTHMVVGVGKERGDGKSFRQLVSTRARLPRIVNVDWIEESWAEKTLLDEERYAP